MNDRQTELLNRALEVNKANVDKWMREFDGDRDAVLALASAMLADTTMLYRRELGPGKAAMILYSNADKLAAANISVDKFDKR